MAFGLSLIRFLCRPSEALLLSAGPEKAVECWIELYASFRPSCGRRAAERLPLVLRLSLGSSGVIDRTHPYPVRLHWEILRVCLLPAESPG